MATKTIAWGDGDGNITVNYGGSGNGTITISSDGNNLHSDRSKEITVKTADGSIVRTITVSQAAKPYISLNNAVVTAPTQTYTGSALNPTPIVTLDGAVVTATNYDVSWSNNINAGTGTVTVTGKGDYTGSASGSFTIAKANQSAPTAYDASTTYPNTATASASGGGGVGSLEWESAQSQGSVGSHTTRARWTGDGNYNPSPWSNYATVTMSKAAGEVSISGVSLTYNGYSRNLASVSGNTGTMHYSTDYSNWSTDIPTATDAGSWTIYWYMDATSNYEGIGASTSRYVSSGIDKASQSAPTAYGATTTYPTTATASASGGGGVGSIEWESAQSQTSVGSHYTRARWSGNSNYHPSPWSDYVTVQMVEQAISIPTPTGVSRAYNGEAAYASFGAATGATITKYRYSTNGSSWTETTTNPSQTNAGTLYVQAYYAAGTNYTGSGWSSSATIAIAKANISPMVSMSGWIYGETANDPSVSGNSGGGTVTYYYKVQWAPDEYYTTTKPENSYSYTVKAVIAETANYNGGTCTANFTISQREVTLTWGTLTWTYDGSAHSTTCTAGNLVSGDSCTVTLTGNSITNAGSTTVTASYLSGGNNNYKLPSSTTATLTVTKATGYIITAPTAKNISYTGSAQTVANEGSATGTIYYRLDVVGSYSTAMPTAINPGSYTLYYFADESANYTVSGVSSISVTIKESYSSTYGYVSNGLVFALDGVSKGHDSTKWLDLVGGLEFPFENCTKGASCVTFNGSGLTKTYCSKTFPKESCTIEVVCDHPQNSSFVLFPPNSGDVLFGFSGTGGGNVVWSSTSAAIVNNKPTDKIFSFNGEVAVLNGRKVVYYGSDSWGSQIDGYLKIGGRGTDKFYSGNIYSIRIYNRKLTESEIRSNHAIDNSRFNLGFHIENTYISSGLIFQLDGINKGSGSTYWTDLAGGVTFPYGSVATKGSSYVTFNGSGAITGTPARTYYQDPGTVEAVYTRPSSDSAILFPASQGELLLLHRPHNSTTDKFYYGSSTAKVYSGDIEQTICLGMNGNVRVKNTYPSTSYLFTDSWSAQIDGTVKIGSRGTDYKYTGRIYAIRMYNRNLTEKEIIQNQRLDNIRFGLNMEL